MLERINQIFTTIHNFPTMKRCSQILGTISIFNLLADKYDRIRWAFREAFSWIWWRVRTSFGRKITGESRTAKAVDFGSYWSPVRCLRTCFQNLPDDVKDRWQNEQIYYSMSHVDSFFLLLFGERTANIFLELLPPVHELLQCVSFRAHDIDKLFIISFHRPELTWRYYILQRIQVFPPDVVVI